MCGIIGYIGNKQVIPVILNGLSNLEYRGYDSAGIAYLENSNINIYKAQGKLQNLKNKTENITANNSLNIGIGHIRWATHGVPNETNAHPHTSCFNKIALVHNGIIENYKELKDDLVKKGYNIQSQTDTEIIVHLIEEKLKEMPDKTTAIRNTLNDLDGAYALGIVFADEPETFFAARKSAPLIVGIGEGENFIASDVPATLEYTKKVIYLEDNEIAKLTKDNVEIFNKKNEKIEKKVELIPWEPVAIDKMGYKHFMLKEIHEQPNVVRQTLSDKLHSSEELVQLNEVKLNEEDLKKLERIQIIACGSSLHAAMVGKYIIEELVEIPVDVEASSEYIYKKNITGKNSLTIGISQSGETADTLTAIRQSKEKGSHALIITNRVDSTMAREADSLLPINAGIEVSVAATKSYTAQLLALYLLALNLAEIKKSVSNEKLTILKEELLKTPQQIEIMLSNKKAIQKCARKYYDTRDFIYIARGINFPAALEGALKLKEISYINATGYPAGELKHGPIAMLDNTIPVLSVLVPGTVYEKVLSNSEESKARDANIIAVTSSEDEKLESIFDYIIRIPQTDELISPIITTVPLQLLAYYIAEFLGKDVDQPRNLAKSVTVE